jgi:hypothetical protein
MVPILTISIDPKERVSLIVLLRYVLTLPIRIEFVSLTLFAKERIVIECCGPKILIRLFATFESPPGVFSSNPGIRIPIFIILIG